MYRRTALSSDCDAPPVTVPCEAEGSGSGSSAEAVPSRETDVPSPQGSAAAESVVTKIRNAAMPAAAKMTWILRIGPPSRACDCSRDSIHERHPKVNRCYKKTIL